MSTPCPACGDPMPYLCHGPDYCGPPTGGPPEGVEAMSDAKPAQWSQEAMRAANDGIAAYRRGDLSNDGLARDIQRLVDEARSDSADDRDGLLSVCRALADVGCPDTMSATEAVYWLAERRKS